MSEHTVYWVVGVGPYGPTFLIAGPFIADDDAEKVRDDYNSKGTGKYRAEVHIQRIHLETL